MAYFLFKRWKERLFSLRREEVIPRETKLPLTFLPINDENAAWVTPLRGEIYEKQFREQLALGDFGYYACVDGKPVGYGWAKHTGSDDYFFEIGADCVYLCRFFVTEEMRGNGIYPALITALIEREANCVRFYIAVEEGNASSERGLSKVGFHFVGRYAFLRGFKHTFNKKQLR